MRTILLADQAMHLAQRLDSHQIASLSPHADFPAVPLRNRGDFTRQAPAKERAIARRQQRRIKSITGRGDFSASFVDFN